MTCLRQKKRPPKHKQPSNSPGRSRFGKIVLGVRQGDRGQANDSLSVLVRHRVRGQPGICLRTILSRFASVVLRARMQQRQEASRARREDTKLIGRAKTSPTRIAMQARRGSVRALIACLGAAATSWISVGHGTEKQDLVCVKPGALSPAENQQRKLDNYTEKSPDPSKTCAGCRFFTAGVGPTACGKCELFNGPANPKGKCDDWTARPV